MKVGVIGLGRMGQGIAKRLHQAGFEVWGYDINPEVREDFSAIGDRVYAARTPEELASQVSIVWVMVPAGSATTEVILDEEDGLLVLLSSGDIVLNAGNCWHQDSINEARKLQERGIYHLDVGCSGGILGIEQGYCLMVGGDQETFEKCEAIFQVLAYRAEDGSYGYGLVGAHGAGHYLKTMIHNGILEYALMQAFGDFAVFLTHPKLPYQYEPAQVCGLLNKGSVCMSRLLGLTQKLFQQPDLLAQMGDQVGSAGQWAKQAIIESLRLDLPVIAAYQALASRMASNLAFSKANQVQAGLRYLFGGHAFTPKDAQDQ